MTKIMLVEDDNNLREIYEARLAAEGYEIVSAADGEAALALAGKEHPEMIISDVMMPKISGFEMLDILRNTDSLRNVKIIMLTALGQAEDSQRANALGADRYLVKSQVTLEDIVKATHELLDDPRDAEPDMNTVVPTDISEVNPIAMPDAEEGTAELNSAGPKDSEDSEAVAEEPVAEEAAGTSATEPAEEQVAEPETTTETETPAETENAPTEEPSTEPAVEQETEPTEESVVADVASEESVQEALAAEPDAPAATPVSITVQEPESTDTPTIEPTAPADESALTAPKQVVAAAPSSVSIPVTDNDTDNAVVAQDGSTDDSVDDSSIPVASEPSDETAAELTEESSSESAPVDEPAADESTADEAAAARSNDPLAEPAAEPAEEPAETPIEAPATDAPMQSDPTSNLHPISNLPISHLPPEEGEETKPAEDGHFEVPVISLDGGVSNVDAADALKANDNTEETAEATPDYTSPSNFNNFQVPMPGSENTPSPSQPPLPESTPESAQEDTPEPTQPQSAADEEASIKSKIDDFVSQSANTSPPEVEISADIVGSAAAGAIVVSDEPTPPETPAALPDEALVAEEPPTVAPSPEPTTEPSDETSEEKPEEPAEEPYDGPGGLEAETLDESADDKKVYDSGFAASTPTEIMVPQDTLEPNDSRLPIITGPGINGAPEQGPDGIAEDTSTDNDDDLVAAAAAALAAAQSTDKISKHSSEDGSDDDEDARKLVTPIGGNKPKPDLHQLLALEDAKNAASQAASDAPKPNVDAYKPSGQQVSDNTDGKPADPNHVAL